VTPEVHYDSWKEFVDLVYLVQDVFCNLLAEAVQQEFQTEHLLPVLGSIYCRIQTLAHLKATGPSVIMQLTKSNCEFWCSMVSHFVCARALRAATIFEDVSTSLSDMAVPLSALQSIQLYGIFRQPILVLSWQDVKYHYFTWRNLRALGIEAQALKQWQPDKDEWLQRGGIQLRDLIDMVVFPVNPLPYWRFKY
jgi:hypothetical protein